MRKTKNITNILNWIINIIRVLCKIKTIMYYKNVLVPISFASWKTEVSFVSSISCALVERWQKMIKFMVCVSHDLSKQGGGLFLSSRK